MRIAGLDVGSRTIKLVVLEEHRIVLARKIMTSFDPLESVLNLIEKADYDRMVATGYGRHLIKEHLDCPVISEIKAFALGSRAVFPDCRAILDIGGQDTKAISLGDKGELKKFEMNDRCAAGTGRFLEIMANALNYSLVEFSKAASLASRFERINNMCTVFAESEVISLINRGAKREEVVLGIHRAIATRSVGLLRRVAPEGAILFAGGVALNESLSVLIAEELRRPIHVPSDPQIIGAIGAALYASNLTDCYVTGYDGANITVRIFYGDEDRAVD